MGRNVVRLYNGCCDCVVAVVTYCCEVAGVRRYLSPRQEIFQPWYLICKNYFIFLTNIFAWSKYYGRNLYLRKPQIFTIALVFIDLFKKRKKKKNSFTFRFFNQSENSYNNILLHFCYNSQHFIFAKIL